MNGVVIELGRRCHIGRMMNPAPSYHGYRFPPDIIAHAVWLVSHIGSSLGQTVAPEVRVILAGWKAAETVRTVV